jgi:hypothetical protein
MQTAWRPLLHPSPLALVGVVTLVALLVASAFFVRGVTELLGVNSDGILGPLQSLGL